MGSDALSTDGGLEAWLTGKRKKVDALLDRLLPQPPAKADPGRLVEAMRHSLLTPGKRLRPILAMAAAEAVGAEPTEPRAKAAAAVELVHCYSLIHDDLPAMDNADMRRGRPSCHRAFGEATAILAGDALLTLAFEWLADAGLSDGNPGRYLRAQKLLATAAGMAGMVRGQARDLGEPAPDDFIALELLHREKTAALFRVSLEVGAVTAGASAHDERALATFGELFGIAFQHADDLSDGDHPGFAQGAREQVRDLTAAALVEIAPFGPRAEPLRALTRWLAAQVN